MNVLMEPTFEMTYMMTLREVEHPCRESPYHRLIINNRLNMPILQMSFQLPSCSDPSSEMLLSATKGERT